MNGQRNKLIKWIATATVALLPSLGHAACTDLRTAVIPPDQAEIGLIQRGLQTALEDSNPLLADNRFGAYTRVRLVQFCGQFPLPATTNSVTGTVTLAQEYGELAGAVNDWKILTSDAGFAFDVLPSDDTATNAAILPLVGPPYVTATALRGIKGATDCAELTNDTLDQTARAGLLALSAIDPPRWPDAMAVCTDLDLPGGANDTRAVLRSLGYFETMLASSVNQMLAPDFALWLGEEIGTRGPRLVGSDDAVVALVAEYRAANRPAAPRDFSALYQNRPPSCGGAPQGTIIDYYSFDQAALDGLVAPVDVNGLLAGLAGQTFPTATALKDAVNTALSGQVSACTLDQINIAITSSDNFGQAYMLNAEKTANLALVESFADSEPVVAPFVGLSAQSRAGLLAGIRAALQTATQERILAQVDEAATLLALAAEPLSDTFDTLPEGVPAFEEVQINPTIGVTEATDSAIIATVQDLDFRAALLGTNFAPAPNQEVLKANARSVLLPLAQAKVTAIVNRDMIQLQTAVDASWALTPTLSAAIAAAPAVTAPQDTAPVADGPTALDTLAGIEYPNPRLFEAALAQLTPPPAPSVVADIRTSARQTAANPSADRNTAIALPDCGCVSSREIRTEVYGFYPFWFAAPLIDAALDPAAAPDTAPAGRQIDFGLVSRAAFYGLEFAISDGPNGALVLRNEAQWTTGQRNFVNAAHQHRAQADLAVQLTGWADWSDIQIATAVQKIVTLTAPFPRTSSSDLRALWAEFPTVLDRPQVDAVTLIIGGYDGTAIEAPGAARLVSMVTLLKSELAARDQTINLAFDLVLNSDTETAPLFRDIRAVMIGGQPIVDKVLIFLERPTTNAKKLLYARMEAGAFQGIDRARVLRRIIPVIPPSGHENVLQNRIAANGDTPVAKPFSQFRDDLVYFQNSFAGVGFWPAPDPAAPDANDIKDILADEWFRPTLPVFLASFEDDVDKACTVICPNRTYVAAGLALIFALTVLLVWRSFYSGFVDKLAFKLGLAWAAGAVLFAGLLALTVCDHTSLLAPVLLFGMVAGVILLFGFYIYQSARNGPKP